MKQQEMILVYSIQDGKTEFQYISAEEFYFNALPFGWFYLLKITM